MFLPRRSLPALAIHQLLRAASLDAAPHLGGAGHEGSSGADMLGTRHHLFAAVEGDRKMGLPLMTANSKLQGMVHAYTDAVAYVVLLLWNLTHWLSGSVLAAYHAGAVAVHAASLASFLAASDANLAEMRVWMVVAVRILDRAVPLFVALDSGLTQITEASLTAQGPAGRLLAQLWKHHSSSPSTVMALSWVSSLLFWHTTLLLVSSRPGSAPCPVEHTLPSSGAIFQYSVGCNAHHVGISKAF